MNRVMLIGHLTRDPEMRALASGKTVTSFTIATLDDVDGAERAEHHSIVTWDKLAETCGRYLGRHRRVAVEGRLQTRSWDDEVGRRHWKTEIVADRVEVLSGRSQRAMREALAADNSALGTTSS